MARSNDAFLVRESSDPTVDGEVWGLEVNKSDGSKKIYGIAGADGQAEAARKEAEEARVAAEKARETAEAEREKSESARKEAETARQTAEDDRAEAEGARAEAESARATAEQARATAEAERASSESSRAAAETERASAEDERKSAETSRAEAEGSRVSAEMERSTAEEARAAAEKDRSDAEALRETAEEARAAAESAREQAQAKNNADQAANNLAAQGLQVVILTAGQYDQDTLMPTIEGESGRIYFVPIPSQAMSAIMTLLDSSDEEPGNNYLEWMWINSAWERVGMSNATLVSLTTDEIDTVTSNGSVTSESVLNGTGLTYLWSKIRAKFAAIAHTHAQSDITNLSNDLASLRSKDSSQDSAINGKAPTNHASTGTGYGVGNGSAFGHLKLSDSTTWQSDANGGVAATPAAVKAVRDSVSHYTSNGWSILKANGAVVAGRTVNLPIVAGSGDSLVKASVALPGGASFTAASATIVATPAGAGFNPLYDVNVTCEIVGGALSVSVMRSQDAFLQQSSAYRVYVLAFGTAS